MERIAYKDFYIDKTAHGYRICRSTDTSIHTHLKNLQPAYKLIDNVVAKIMPRRCGIFYLQSHIRLSTDEDYIRKLNDYIKVKQNKEKQYYYNPHKKKF